MKLIVDISESGYESLKATNVIISGQRSGKTLMSMVYNAVAHGIPLDDVKAEIAKIEIPEEVKTVDGCFAFCQALEIADLAIDRVVDKHIGKAESEGE